MKLNHLNLTVSDVSRAREFLETYFGLTTLAERNYAGDGFAMMTDDNGSALSLMEKKQVSYPGTFHVGFVQVSEGRVEEINRRLKDDGFEVKPPARLHGAWSFYVQAPGGFTVEVLGSDDPRFPFGG
jgi:catechol 2,3-dioxygenase-like lactoylglutathione lyase family enzyme